MYSCPDSATIMAVATDACRAAGQLLKKAHTSGDIRAHVMAAHDVKLEIDRTAERIVSRIIHERRPMDGILAEESGAIRLTER